MSRDYIYSEEDDIVIVVDNCGSVGNLELDSVESSPYNVAYFSTRVVLMEMLSIGSKPFSCSVSIFNPEFYDEYINGVNNAFDEANINVSLISTTETNFKMKESAFSITLIGRGKTCENLDGLQFGVIGTPYVGDEVLKNSILSIIDFKTLLNDNNIKYILPVGSKGIKYEFETNTNLKLKSCKTDIFKSAGPATVVIIGYKDELDIYSNYENLFNKIIVE